MKVYQNKIVKSLIHSIVFIMILILFIGGQTKAATEKKYGILVADKKGTYTFYNLNTPLTNEKIETLGGKIMIPLNRFLKTVPHVTYTYNKKNKTATVTNKTSGKKLVYKVDSKTYTYYPSPKSMGVKKTMAYKMYLSKTSKKPMVLSSSLGLVMNTSTAYKYYNIKAMEQNGYDTAMYSGILVYNPYEKVSGLVKATEVNKLSRIIKLTIPEGYTVPQIFNLLVKKGVCTSTKELYNTMAQYDYNYYPLVSKLEDNESRCYKLEGYLYPDTYEFYRLSKPQDAIGKFLRNTEAKITEADRNKAETLGCTVNQILTIASLIEKEAGTNEHMPLISSVIHNRLGKSMKLQLDASIFYVERYIKPFIDGDKDRYNGFYNTYKCKALPAGPICNPGKKAIHAALNPENTNYLYFYSDEEKVYHFSENLVVPEAKE